MTIGKDLTTDQKMFNPDSLHRADKVLMMFTSYYNCCTVEVLFHSEKKTNTNNLNFLMFFLFFNRVRR